MSGIENKRSFFAGCVCLLWVMARIDGLAAGLDFQRDVRPILSDFCYPCHGPDEKERKGKLRLDLREEIFKFSQGKSIVKAGKSAESELVHRITSADRRRSDAPAEIQAPPDRSPHRDTPKMD